MIKDCNNKPLKTKLFLLVFFSILTSVSFAKSNYQIIGKKIWYPDYAIEQYTRAFNIEKYKDCFYYTSIGGNVIKCNISNQTISTIDLGEYHYVRSLARRNNTLILATNAGILFYNLDTKQSTSSLSYKNGGFPRRNYNYLLYDSNSDCLWVHDYQWKHGSKKASLDKYDFKTKKWYHINQADDKKIPKYRNNRKATNIDQRKFIRNTRSSNKKRYFFSTDNSFYCNYNHNSLLIFDSVTNKTINFNNLRRYLSILGKIDSTVLIKTNIGLELVDLNSGEIKTILNKDYYVYSYEFKVLISGKKFNIKSYHIDEGEVEGTPVHISGIKYFSISSSNISDITDTSTKDLIDKSGIKDILIRYGNIDINGQGLWITK